jgi:pimeloyl-ACP methyl ester carboxylesterase
MKTYSKLDSPAILSTLFPLTERDKKISDSGTPVKIRSACSCSLFSGDKENPVFLSFLPVNSENFLEKLVQHGINVFAVTFSPDNTDKGGPSMTTLMASLAGILEDIKKYMTDNGLSGKLFVNGKSSGSIFALELASVFQDEFKGVILESAVCDTLPFLEASGVSDAELDFSESEGFNNLEKIEKIKLPTMFLHGSRDTLVAPALAEKLQASSGARTKQFHLVPGADHWSVAETAGELYYQTIKSFVDTICGINTWRQRRRKFRGRNK